MGGRAIAAVGLFALGVAAPLLETGLTRVLSFKLAHNLAPLLVAGTMLAISLGARAAARASARVRVTGRAPAGSAASRGGLAGVGLAAAAALASGGALLAHLRVEMAESFDSPIQALRLALLLAPWAAVWAALGGLAGSLLGGLHLTWGCASLLIGLAAGSGGAALLAGWAGGPSCLALGGALLAGVGAACGRRRAPWLAAGAGCAALGLALLACLPSLLPDPVADRSVKHLGSVAGALYSRWGPLARVDVLDTSVETGGLGLRAVYLDGTWSDSLLRFRGDTGALAWLKTDPRGLAYRLLSSPPGRVAVLGAGGNRQVLQALAQGASSVEVVEESPAAAALLSDVFAGSTGQLGRHPSVTLRREGVRAFLAREPGPFDVVQLAAPRTLAASSAALASAGVVAESFQLSAEALELMLRRLSERGVLSVHVGELSWEEPLRSLKLLSTVREAFRRLGVRDPRRHVAVVTSEGFGQLTTVLLKRTPIGEPELEGLLAGVATTPRAALRFAAGRVFDRGLAVDLLLQPDRALDGWIARQPWNLRPVVDDTPFLWRWQRLRPPWAEAAAALPGDIQDGRRERLLLWLLASSLLVLGWLALSPVGGAPRAGGSALALAVLGMAAASCEAGLVNRLAPLLGDPLQVLRIVVPAFFAWAALGTAVGARAAARRGLRIAIALAPAAGWVGLRVGLASPLDGGLAASGPALAVLAAGACAPFALSLGALLPLVLAAGSPLAESDPAQVAAGLGCLAAAFVAGALAASVAAMLWGFAAVLAAGAAGVAVAAGLGVPGARARPA